MDWRNLFLTARGRIGQKDFWIGILVLFVVNILLNLVPVLGQLASLALIYFGVCLTAQRLHDFGKSGWLAAVPYGVGAVYGIIAGVAAVMAVGAAGVGGDAAGMGALGALAAIGGLGLLVALFMLGFLLWVGLSRGDPGTNAYGPPPPTLVTAV